MKQRELSLQAMDHVAKRLLDLTGATLGIILFAPIIILVAILCRYSQGAPVLFRQPRAGLNNRRFEIIKFRTMSNRKMSSESSESDRERITRFGKLLRRTSLDELPELWNVVRGEMSLVGPRPLLIEYLPLYTAQQARRHEVKPGITGWAQINGRNAISWEDRFMFDIWYVDNQSFLLDLRILLLTVFKVISCEGVSQKGHVSMEKFQRTLK